jgi:murein DD-endopeptidase MepM/ murein hydrolase activator NlpD
MRSILVTLAAVVALLVPAASAPAGAWERPVEGPVLRPFAVGPDRFAAGQHRGIDLGAPPGIRVLAACGGRVTFAGRVPRGGRTVSVRCGPLVATYQHLCAVAVRRGQIVLPGARIGKVGHARPRPHVHLGARDAATGAYVDPLGLFAGAPRVVPAPVGVQRRPLPLGPTPVAVQRRPLPLGPAPAARRPRARPSALPTAHPAAIPPRAGASRLPWPVWLGLALVALGLPLGGALTVRRRRQAPVPLPQTAS